jgi:hypothetical protein
MPADALQETQFEQTPSGWAQRWAMELKASRSELEKWHAQGAKIVKRFRDEREGHDDMDTRWNLFSSGIEVKQATLYGQTPKVSVSRRFADARDDVARVAAELMERLLNSDIEKDGDTFSQALQYALEDRLLPGLGVARVRYVAEFETVPGKPPQVDPMTGAELAPAVPETEQKSYECVETDYVHWRDFLWSPARVWHEVRWLGFRAQMSREELVQRFGENVGKALPLNAKSATSNSAESEQKSGNPWARADVWEIWSKEHGKVFWFVEGYPNILDEKDDPMGLEGFWPCPRPMLANVTTSSLVPKGDFAMAQDLYNEIDYVSTRITKLERAIKVVGVYDKTADGVRRMLSETTDNELIPVENWAAFAEKGGVKSQIDWLPLEQVANALSTLRDYRSELVEALYQVTGMSDIMRGQASDVAASATEQSIKAKFGSVRLQRMQDEFARFASDLQKLKAEIISKHFEPQTILSESNAQFSFDMQSAMQAVQLIKDRFSSYRIEVKPEAISLTDFAALKAERMEVLSSMAGFFQAMAPIAQSMPGATPMMLQMLQWAVAGLRGASQIEGVIDQAIEMSKQAQTQQSAQPQQPDPKIQALQLKGQLDMQKAQADLHNDLIRTQAEVQAEDAKQRIQTDWNVKEEVLRTRIKQAMAPVVPTHGPGGIGPLGGGR